MPFLRPDYYSKQVLACIGFLGSLFYPSTRRLLYLLPSAGGTVYTVRNEIFINPLKYAKMSAAVNRCPLLLLAMSE